MRIQNNIPGMLSRRYGKELNNKTSKSLEKLSSGCRINRAGDDAAGLSVSEKIRVNLTGYERCIDNVREGMSLANTADAALQEVNDMLCRANELCVTAANGTYTEHEREMLLDELNALYDEMDRIFESSRFNSTQLFRHDDGDFSNGTFEYIENVIVTAPDDLQQWGALGNIDRVFDLAEPAQSATAKLTLDSDIRTAQDLIGRNFEIMATDGSVYTVSFTTGTGSGGTYDENLSIGVDDCTTVQQAFDKLCDATAKSVYWKGDNIVLDKANTLVNGNTVTLSFHRELLSDSVGFQDGTSVKYEIPEGDGEVANGVLISSREDGNLRPIDDGGNEFTASMSFELYPGKADDYVLTAADKTLLGSTYLYVADYTFTFQSGASNGTSIDLDRLTTAADLRAAVVNTVNDLFAARGKDVSLSPAAADGTVTLTYKDYPSGKWVYDSVATQHQYVATGTLNGISQRVVQNAGGESYEVTKITLPSLSALTDDHFTLKIGATEHHFYDSSKLLAGYTTSGYDIYGKSEEQIYEAIRSRVANEYGRQATVTLAGNEITLTATTINKQLNVSVTSQASEIFTYLPNQPDDAVIDGYHYFENYSFTWDIAGATGNDEGNICLLAEDGNCAGFRLNGTLYQFVDDASAVVSSEAELIDISMCQTYADVAAALQSAIPDSVVTLDGGKITVAGVFSNRDLKGLSFEDGFFGENGLFNETAGTTATTTSSGGTKTGHPSATIDFSRYNADNFRELYGKGFRVTCATCEGEYINVIFCYDKAQCSFPASFEKTDPVSGEIRTIHNLVVELQGMSDGSDIVQSIVTQLSPELDHYTGVAVGNPSSVLEVYDKRRGDLVDPVDPSRELRAEVMSGVLTNCVYTVKENFYAAPDDIVGDIEIDYRNMNIFANADGDGSYITIHLPYLTLKNLKLKPPEPDFSTPEKALQTLERVLQANNAISSMRGQLGADFNRLQHAYESLTDSEIQAADAYSRIRDTDMAEMMTEQTKLSILKQAQQAAQAHTLKMPQQILELLQ